MLIGPNAGTQSIALMANVARSFTVSQRNERPVITGTVTAAAAAAAAAAARHTTGSTAAWVSKRDQAA